MDTLSILCLVQGSDGTLYAGSDGSGIYAIKDGIVSTYGFREGLQEGVVLRMLEDEDGGFFVSAGSNLYYWKDQVFTSLSDFQKGAGSIFDFYLKDGKLWLLQNSGVIAVDAEALLAGEKTNAEVFSFSLGLTGSLNANTWHKVCEDGSLMLATRNGISVFAFKGVEGQPPFVVLNEVKVDEEVYRAPEEIRLSKNAKRITFDFSMLSYNDPDKYQMACYLEGAEDDEHIYTEEKSAEISYTNLSGGEYIFRLKVYRLGEEKEIYEYQIPVYKDRRLTEYWLFWLVSAVLFVLLVALVMAGSFSLKMRRIQKRHKEYQEIVNQSLETFAKTIDAKDTYTNGHSARVAAYSREIAVRMGLSSEEQENVYYIALMHDIGKIGIPDSILKKQSELTEEEWEIVKKHPVIGGEILKDFTALEGIADGARYHHERFDGKGYCVGIKGEEIPLVARIIGIADAFDAMATTRFYRKAMDITEILKELERGSGTQFDPEILPIMLEMVKDGTVTIE
ncbi:MAG: HD domain-containing protein [Lachnospiraceae bacterium]|nr:HD domain-containing protein [Lachnospiraceae bacterium]